MSGSPEELWVKKESHLELGEEPAEPADLSFLSLPPPSPFSLSQQMPRKGGQRHTQTTTWGGMASLETTHTVASFQGSPTLPCALRVLP